MKFLAPVLALSLVFILSPYGLEAKQKYSAKQLQKCIQNSPYECPHVARQECLRHFGEDMPKVESVPEKFQREDRELANRNERARKKAEEIEQERKRKERIRKLKKAMKNKVKKS